MSVVTAQSERTDQGPQEVARPLTVIRPTKGWRALNLAELWDYRELLYFLAWRDVKVRYKQTVLGAAWALIQPLFLMLVFTLVFGRLANVSSQGLPYPIFAFAGLVPWTLFSQAVGGVSNSLVASSGLVAKVYFPRLVIPLASAGAYLVDFALAFGVLIVMMLYYGVGPTAAVVWLPAFTLLAIAAALSVGILLSALNVKYRDVRYAVPFLIQVLLFVTPLGYSSQQVPGAWRLLYQLNPMVAVVEGFRWSLLGVERPATGVIVVPVVVTVLLLVGGLAYFRRAERTFADVI